jgi:hypothetical protein
MGADPISLIWRIRMWLAGQFFLLAGRLDSAYDVWLDDTLPRRHP